MSTAATQAQGSPSASNTAAHTWRRELDDLIRGASGGFLFGVPLLYTMEVWWIGSSAPPYRMLVAIITSFVVVMLLNRTAGFRRTGDIRWLDAALDSVEALALGLVCSAIILVLIREVQLATPLTETLGKTVFEGMPFAIGVALANQVLGGGRDAPAEGDDDAAQTDAEPKSEVNATIADIGATVIGAIFIAFNIAPTDEIPMLSAAITPPWLLAIAAASLLISYGIVFAAGFTDQQRRHEQQGLLQSPISETLASYLVSLVAAMFMLWFFGKIELGDPWTMWLSFSIVLGLPATVGGAAGRLAV